VLVAVGQIWVACASGSQRRRRPEPEAIIACFLDYPFATS